KDKVMFLVKGEQAGVFRIKNVAESEMGAVLSIRCVNILFPSVRESVSDAVTRIPDRHAQPGEFRSAVPATTAKACNRFRWHHHPSIELVLSAKGFLSGSGALACVRVTPLKQL
ncbi:MAG: protein-export chaperone SecB, partial [Nitrospira sp.]|nr:protein-export chaperone SecB [Nitrospira sp.]